MLKIRLILSLITSLIIVMHAPPASAQSDVNDLESALLTLGDLQPGWLASFPGEQGAYTTTRCGQDLTDLYPTIARQFKGSEIGPGLIHEIVIVPPGEGEAVMAAQRERLAACPEWVTTQAGRPTLRWQAARIPFPEITDEAFAFRSVAPMLLVGQATGDHVTLRHGDIFNLVTYASVGTHDTGALELYARMAAAKLAVKLSGS
jgi:hypothetical protein